MKIEFYTGTCPLWTARSTTGMDRVACPSLERAPLMAVMEDLSREKQRWQRNQAIALAAFTLELSRFEIDLEPIRPTGLVSVHTQQANPV